MPEHSITSGTTSRYALGGVGVLLAVVLSGCGGSDAESGESEDRPTASASASAPADDLATLALGTSATAAERPAWMFPVRVDGWDVDVINEGGKNKLVDGDSSFTTYQADRDMDAGDDEATSRAFLERYVAQLDGTAQVAEVTEPVYGVATIETGDGLQRIEMVQQDLTYTGTSGDAYRSRFLTRALDDTTMSVQYEAPEGTWSEQEWEKLIEGLSIDVTLTGVDD